MIQAPDGLGAVIAGSRGITDEEEVFAVLDEHVGPLLPSISFFVSGNAGGIDRLGERWAESKGYTRENGKLIIAKPDWERYGKSAGHRRNAEMADVAGVVIVLWDGVSPGSKGMVETSLKKGKWVKVYRWDRRGPM